MSTTDAEESLLSGRVAIVTGGARGIGRAVSRLLASHGVMLVVNDSGVSVDGREPDPRVVRDVVDEVVRSGGRAVADDGDVADTKVGERLVARAIEQFGGLDVVVNAAGILRDRMVFNMSDDDWDEVVRVHLRGHFSTIRPAAAHWRSRRNPGGHYRIINVTSDSGLQGSPGQPNYAAAKMGVVGLTYSCAQSLRRYGVTANAIAPGAATRMMGTIPDQRQLIAPDDSLAPENVALLVAYVAGAATDWLSGRVLGATGYGIRLYSNPEVVATMSRPTPWTLSEIAEEFERTVRPLADGVPPSMFSAQIGAGE